MERSDLRGAAAILRDYALVAGIAGLSVWLSHPVAYVAAVWMIGLVQLGIGEALTHEATHHNLFRTRRLNDLGEIFYCLPFFFSLADYRKEHHEHHHLLNTDKEKLFDNYTSYGLHSPRRNMPWIWFCKPVVGFGALTFVRSLVDLGSRRTVCKLLAFWLIVGGGFAAAGHLDVLVLYWIVPLLWCFSSFFYWSEIEDHYNTRSGTRTNTSWTNLITHNNGYHYVHHRFPTIPWYRLREAHRELCADTPDLSRGFLDTYRQISNETARAGEGGRRPEA